MRWLLVRLGIAELPLGARGEREAARWLRRRGFRILERNFHVGDDEADLLAIDPDGRTLVVVEVKTRAADDIAPESGVDERKQFRLARLAARLMKMRRFSGRPIRFDAIAVIWPQRGAPHVRHIVAAFDSPI
jgi:putative endonuclease